MAEIVPGETRTACAISALLKSTCRMIGAELLVFMTVLESRRFDRDERGSTATPQPHGLVPHRGLNVHCGYGVARGAPARFRGGDQVGHVHLMGLFSRRHDVVPIVVVNGFENKPAHNLGHLAGVDQHLGQLRFGRPHVTQ